MKPSSCAGQIYKPKPSSCAGFVGKGTLPSNCIYCNHLQLEWCRTCNGCENCCPDKPAKPQIYKPCHHCGAPINVGLAAEYSAGHYNKKYGVTYYWCEGAYQSVAHSYQPVHIICVAKDYICKSCSIGKAAKKAIKTVAKKLSMKSALVCRRSFCDEAPSCESCAACEDCCYCAVCSSCGNLRTNLVTCNVCDEEHCYDTCSCNYCGDGKYCHNACETCGACSGSCSCYNEPDVAEEIWGIDPTFPLNEAIAKFYLLNHLAAVAPSHFGPQFDEYAIKLADLFARYLDMVVGGEIRYGSEELSDAAKRMPRIAPRVTRTLRRGAAWAAWADLRKEFGVDVLQEAEDCLMNGNWGSAVGGKAWGEVAMHLRKYLEGEYPAFVFVDIAVDLEHNNGCIFNKVWSTDNTKELLDAKFKGWLLPTDIQEPERRYHMAQATYNFTEQEPKAVIDYASAQTADYYKIALRRSAKYARENARELAYFMRPSGGTNGNKN